MSRAHDGEVAVVERRDRGHPEALGGGNDRCVDRSEPEIGVGLDQLRDMRRDDQRAALTCEQFDARLVIRIDADGRGDERPGIYQERDGSNPSSSSRCSASRAENPGGPSPSATKPSRRCPPFGASPT